MGLGRNCSELRSLSPSQGNQTNLSPSQIERGLPWERIASIRGPYTKALAWDLARSSYKTPQDITLDGTIFKTVQPSSSRLAYWGYFPRSIASARSLSPPSSITSADPRTST